MITKLKDKVILTLIFFLNLELLVVMLFYIEKTYQDYSTRCIDPRDISIIATISPYSMFLTISPIAFLSVAILLNLRNWAFYFIKIGEIAYQA
jgi:hypothetical protein